MHEFWEVAVIEGHGGSQHGVQDHAKTPDIAFGTEVRPFENDLGRSVERTTAVRGDHWFRVGVL